MKRTKTSRLSLNVTTIRTLQEKSLQAVAGGVSGVIKTKTLDDNCSGSCTCQYYSDTCTSYDSAWGCC